MDTDTDLIKKRFESIEPFLDERMRRLLAAAEAAALGHGGITKVSRATGVSRPTITAGLEELADPSLVDMKRVRRAGGGRKRTVDTDPTLVQDLESLIEPSTRGDPESPLRWTSKSVRKLARELNDMGHPVSHRLVAELLHELDYSLQANRKTKEGDSHPDRDMQFEHINAEVKTFQAAGQPAISVDTKKKELVGDFKNGGREWQPQGEPEKVRVHDFLIPELGKVAPYGIYDITHNLGWVNVGIDHDTATFAVESIRRTERFPRGMELHHIPHSQININVISLQFLTPTDADVRQCQLSACKDSEAAGSFLGGNLLSPRLCADRQRPLRGALFQ
jgi:DNA-binding phage protein